jgi:hypothetical protein
VVGERQWFAARSLTGPVAGVIGEVLEPTQTVALFLQQPTGTEETGGRSSCRRLMPRQFREGGFGTEALLIRFDRFGMIAS